MSMNNSKPHQNGDNSHEYMTKRSNTSSKLIGVMNHILHSPFYNPNATAILYQNQYILKKNTETDADTEDSTNTTSIYWPIISKSTTTTTSSSESSYNKRYKSDHNKQDCGDNFSSITYQTLFQKTKQLAKELAHQLAVVILQSQQQEQQNCKEYQQPVIGISIPEGPYLPLAVLAIHYLTSSARTTSTNSTDDLKFRPIMIPMDPQEGLDRLKHMLLDAHPCIILCLGEEKEGGGQGGGGGGGDLGRIQSVVEEMDKEINHCEKERNDDDGGGRQESSKWKPPIILNLQQVVDISSCSEESPSPITSPNEKEDGYNHDCISHIVYTSGTTGKPKGCINSLSSLLNYLPAKNNAHSIKGLGCTQQMQSRVLLASSLPFDPCLSDILATIYAGGILCLSPRCTLQNDLWSLLQSDNGDDSSLGITHILCTPTLWNTLPAPRRNNDEGYVEVGSLEVVALGGEPIPKRIISTWARKYTWQDNDDDTKTKRKGGVKMFATYGVTEACVYQTAGEVFWNDLNTDGGSNINGQDVGLPLSGINIRICKEYPGMESNSSEIGIIKKSIEGENCEKSQMNILEDREEGHVGEVVISGLQVDFFSAYLNLPQQTKEKFLSIPSQSQNRDDDSIEYFYRTGDRGFINPQDMHLHILGRIDGEEGMIKINGIRVELGEIEHAILDDFNTIKLESVVTNCVVTAKMDDTLGKKRLTAYCVLSKECLDEIGIERRFYRQMIPNPEGQRNGFSPGVLCTPSPLLALLRSRCVEKLRKGTTPSSFILLQSIPMTPTGKSNRKVLPPVDSCVSLLSLDTNGRDKAMPLEKYGVSGAPVAAELISCLNLQNCQKSMLTTNADFAMLGGDSLAATRIVRGLYAKHHGINNSRNLGGSFGSLGGAFDVSHLLGATTLQAYVDFLDSQHVLGSKSAVNDGATVTVDDKTESSLSIKNQELDNKVLMYEALVEAIALGQTCISLALLEEGADPNLQDHGKRLGKTSHRVERMQSFTSNPLHLACVRGNFEVVRALIRSGCNPRSPNASGLYPLHLACAGVGSGLGSSGSSEAETLSNGNTNEERHQEDLRRTECVRLLLEVGKVPLSMKDGSKQTALHCAARGGHVILLEYLMKKWKENPNIKVINKWGTKFDWQDRWFRTPVHWTVLNGNIAALQVLLKNGCMADPPKPKASVGNRSTSGSIESPIDICNRLYDTDSGIGNDILKLLTDK